MLLLVLFQNLCILADDWLILLFELVDGLVHCVESFRLLEPTLEVDRLSGAHGELVCGGRCRREVLRCALLRARDPNPELHERSRELFSISIKGVVA